MRVMSSVKTQQGPIDNDQGVSDLRGEFAKLSRHLHYITGYWGSPRTCWTNQIHLVDRMWNMHR